MSTGGGADGININIDSHREYLRLMYFNSWYNPQKTRALIRPERHDSFATTSIDPLSKRLEEWQGDGEFKVVKLGTWKF